MVGGQILRGQMTGHFPYARTSQRRVRAEYPVTESWELKHDIPGRLKKNGPNLDDFPLSKPKNVVAYIFLRFGSITTISFNLNHQPTGWLHLVKT